MAITKKRIIDKIEIVGPFKHLQVRYATIIEEDGVEINRTYDRGKGVISPDKDITGEDQEIKDVANIVWTPEVKQAWHDHMAVVK